MDKDELIKRRDSYRSQAEEYSRLAMQADGAAQAIAELLDTFFPAALTIPELGEMLGAKEIGEPEEVTNELH